jgi:NitT/TauT family transport system substrate-binding protein
LTGCGSSSGATTSSGPEKPHITVAALPIIANAPVYIAQQESLFRCQGLDVTLEPVTQSTAAIADLLHGSVDVITGANFVSFFRAQARGVLSLKILANEASCTPNANEVVVLPHSSIRRPGQLVGKTIAVNILSDIQTMTANEVLRANDVDPSRIHYVVVPFPSMAAALAAHRIDADYEVEPFLSEAEDAIGAQPVLDACFGPTLNIPIGGAVTTASWAQQYLNTASRLPAGDGASRRLGRPEPVPHRAGGQPRHPREPSDRRDHHGRPVSHHGRRGPAPTNRRSDGRERSTGAPARHLAADLPVT